MTRIPQPPAWASETQREIVAAAIGRIEETEKAIQALQRLDGWKPVRERLMAVLEAGLSGAAHHANLKSDNRTRSNFDSGSSRNSINVAGRSNLDARIVSKHTFGDLSIENVIFKSAIGWEINGTVFRPTVGESFPGVVCPTGSSTKLNYQYWSSAQLIARSGYVVLSYDPPGFVGERREGSDMFAHAPLGYLTGLLPRSFFVFDNAAAIDYLESRSDVLGDRGFGVTGLSLGAQTTINAAIHDQRIRFIAPVCGIMSNLDRLLSQLYTVSCIDMVPDIMYTGMDAARKLSLCAPLPCLLVAGAKDEVFTPEITNDVYEITKSIYALYDTPENLGLFIDPDVGHTYSPAMVNQVVPCLDAILKGSDSSSHTYRYTKEDVIEIPVDAMKGDPDTSLNVRTLNALRATRLRSVRGGKHKTPIGTTAESRLSLSRDLAGILRVQVDGAQNVQLVSTAAPVRSWVHDFTRTRIEGDGFTVPSVLVARAGAEGAPGLVFVDERGAWAGIAGHGYLAKAFRFLDRTESEHEPVVLSIDASAFGSLEHEHSAYDATSWSDPDSTLAYIGFAAGCPVAGLRVRDALAALQTLADRPEVDPRKLMIAGFGEGAVTALFTSCIYAECVRTILVDPPLSFEEIATAPEHTWRRGSFVYDILTTTDIPELAASTTSEVHVIRPLDALRHPVSAEQGASYYDAALNSGQQTDVPNSSVQVSYLEHTDERDAAFVDAVLSPLSLDTD